MLLSIPAEETKNGSADNAELPPDVAQLYDVYLKRYRPRLAKPGAAWLFAGEVAATARPVASAPSCATSSIARSASR